MNLIEVKTTELIGAALDWAVAQVPGALSASPWKYHALSKCYLHDDTYHSDEEQWSPSSDWSQIGPLIENHQITLLPPRYSGDKWGATYDVNSCMLDGDSALTSACRAIVAAKLGDVVSVPTELVGEVK